MKENGPCYELIPYSFFSRALFALLLALLLLLGEKGDCQVPGTKRWSMATPGNISSSPAIAGDGTLYVGIGDDIDGAGSGWFYSISPQGTTNWVLSLPKHVRASPAIGPDGTVYVGCMDGNLLIINPAGTYSSVATGGQIPSSPALGNDGTIYVGSISNLFNKLYAIKPDGSTNWVFTMGPVQGDPAGVSFQFSSPAVGPDGTIYVGSVDKNLYAITPEGKTNWVFPLVTGTNSSSAASTYASPSIGADGTIYIGADNGVFYAINPSGFKKWGISTGQIIESSAAISDGTIYIGTTGNKLYALAPDGTQKWAVQPSPTAGFSGSPAIGSDGNIYIGSYANQRLYAFNSAGSNLWTYTTAIGEPGQMLSSPAIAPDGTIYFGSGAGLFAVYGSSGLMNSSWPMFRRNVKHTARSIQTGISSPSILADGSFAMNLTIDPERVYQIEYSTNLFNWQELTNFVHGTFPDRFIDTSAPDSASRFYRLSTMAP